MNAYKIRYLLDPGYDDGFRWTKDEFVEAWHVAFGLGVPCELELVPE